MIQIVSAFVIRHMDRKLYVVPAHKTLRIEENCKAYFAKAEPCRLPLREDCLFDMRHKLLAFLSIPPSMKNVLPVT